MDRAENKGFSKIEISWFSKGVAFGFSKGENAGVERISMLSRKLYESGRYEGAKRICFDSIY